MTERERLNERMIKRGKKEIGWEREKEREWENDKERVRGSKRARERVWKNVSADIEFVFNVSPATRNNVRRRLKGENKKGPN